MQCAAIARVIFVASIKQVAGTEEFLVASSLVNAESQNDEGDTDNEFQRYWLKIMRALAYYEDISFYS